MFILSPGASGSGSSTVRKQMQLLCETGFTMEERRKFRQRIFNNIILAFRMILEARRKWGVEYESEISLVGVDFSDSLLAKN